MATKGDLQLYATQNQVVAAADMPSGTTLSWIEKMQGKISECGALQSYYDALFHTMSACFLNKELANATSLGRKELDKTSRAESALGFISKREVLI